jgi:23S rRNA (guanosine2251-2'-O)-methyltransferase
MMEWVYGRHPVLEVLQAGKRKLAKLYIAQGIEGDVITQIMTLARERRVVIDRVPRMRLDQMVRGHHQGVAAQTSSTEYGKLDDFLHENKDKKSLFIVALDEIQDPQNIGSILRSAAFFGVDAVIVPLWRSAPVGDTALRASSGALEHLTLLRVKNLAEAVLELQEAGFQVYGADMSGEAVWNLSPSPRQALIMGSEGEGLRHLVRERCDKLIGIPARAKVKSLNVGSATAILLYEFFRGRVGGSA